MFKSIKSGDAIAISDAGYSGKTVAQVLPLSGAAISKVNFSQLSHFQT